MYNIEKLGEVLLAEAFLYELAGQWYHRELERSGLLEGHPAYPAARHALLRASEGLETCLDETARAAFLEYEAASSQEGRLAEEAAFLTGLAAGLRLCLRL